MNNRAPETLLTKPYARLLFPEVDGTFRGEILEFSGCFAIGDTPSETYANLEEAAADWLASAIKLGQLIPEPFDNEYFSGKLALRLPRSLHRKAARLAERDGVSLNQFIVVALSEHVGERMSTLHSFIVNTFQQVTSSIQNNLFLTVTPSPRQDTRSNLSSNPEFTLLADKWFSIDVPTTPALGG